MKDIITNCRIAGGRVVKLYGIKTAGKLWKYKNADPQIHIEFDEPARSFLFCCETGEMAPKKQTVTIYYKSQGREFSEVHAHRLEMADYDRVEREIRMEFPVKEIRVDPAEEKGSCEVRQLEIRPLEEKTTDERLKNILREEEEREKIVILTHDLSKTGAPILAYNIADHLKRRGWKVVVLAGRAGSGFLEAKYEASHIPVIFLESREEKAEYAGWDWQEWSREGISEKVIRLLADCGYQTVIANTVVSGAYIRQMKDYRMKIISLIHEMKTSIGFYGFLPAGKHVETYADYVVFPNQFVKEDFCKLFPGIKGTCLVRPQGVYLKQGKRTAKGSLEQLGLPEDARIIMSSGSCELRKGVDLFVSGAIMFLNRHKEEKIHFVWTGDFHNVELKCWMLDQIERSGQADRIHFIPFIQDEGLYRTVLGHAEAFWGMSREDPFPSTVLEAMDNRIPVVGFCGTGGIQVMLEEGRGILVENLDLEQFVSRTERLLFEDGSKEEILQKAKRYVESLKFDEYVDFLAELSKEEMQVEPFLDLHQWGRKQQVSQNRTKEKGQAEKQRELDQAVSADRFRRRKIDKNEMVLLDTAVGSDNVGDEIIMEACGKACKEVFPNQTLRHIPTHIYDPTADTIERYGKILCGTNLISTQMEESGQWAFPGQIKNYKHICLLGVGMQQLGMEQPMSPYTRQLLGYLLHTKCLHSVRDEETKRRLEEIGIRNVLNTGCPTMWGLTTEHCAGIPAGKVKQVVTTVTGDMRYMDKDRYMLELLKTCYEKVYIWIQGPNDYAYLREMIDLEGFQIIPPSLEKLDKVLSKGEIDYIGVGLYGGIRSLQFQRRSLVIEGDSRAQAMAADTGLPVLKRAEMEDKLENWIRGRQKTHIRIPVREIERWKSQFERR